MPIKWNALAVSEAMDALEQQVNLAWQFIGEAEVKAKEAYKVPNVPDYITQAIDGVLRKIDQYKSVMGYIQKVRERIPADALEAERKKLSYGKPQTLI